MDNRRNHELVANARKLRREMTKEERHLWYDYLRHHPVKFRRQAVFGKFIVDFYCAKAKLVVELDGSQHYEPENRRADQLRTEYLEKFGVMVIRIANTDVTRNFRGVCAYIDDLIEARLGEGSISPLSQQADSSPIPYGTGEPFLASPVWRCLMREE